MVKPSEMNGHTGNDEIGTPDELYRWLDRRFQFDYDPAASRELHCTRLYSTPDGTFKECAYGEACADPAGHEHVSELDGLNFEWTDRRVYCNPPYSRPLLGQFIDKAILERNAAEIIVLLVKVDTSTAWWERLAAHAHIEYLPRIQYKGQESPASFQSCIAIIRPDRYSATKKRSRRK